MPSCRPAPAKPCFTNKVTVLNACSSTCSRTRLISSACSPTACWATSGRSGSRRAEKAEFRVHSVEEYQLELWRYGAEKEFIAQYRLARRARPAGDDADHARRRLHADRRRVEQAGLQQQGPWPVWSRRRSGAGCITFMPAPSRACTSAFPWIVAPAEPTRQSSPCWRRTSPGTPTTASAAAAITFMPTVSRRRRRSIRGRNSNATPIPSICTTIPTTMLRCRSTGPNRSTPLPRARS